MTEPIVIIAIDTKRLLVWRLTVLFGIEVEESAFFELLEQMLFLGFRREQSRLLQKRRLTVEAYLMYTFLLFRDHYITIVN